MATRTPTLTHRRNTRNSRNAGEAPGIAFGTQVPSRTAPTTTSKRNSDRTISNNPRGSLNGIPGDDDFGDNRGNDYPDDPDDPDDDGPGNLIEHPDDSDHGDENPGDSEHGIQNNLADAIAALARNVQHQGDGSRAKVRDPDPFDGTDPAKLRTFLVQLQLSFNDRPRAFAEDHRKVNFAISYLKGIALAHFENSLVEPDLLHPPAWGDNYREFTMDLRTYFGSSDLVRKAETKLENLSMNQLSILPNILLNLINTLHSLVGITAHSDTISIADFQPASRTKCHASASPTLSPLSELWHS